MMILILPGIDAVGHDGDRTESGPHRSVRKAAAVAEEDRAVLPNEHAVPRRGHRKRCAATS